MGFQCFLMLVIHFQILINRYRQVIICKKDLRFQPKKTKIKNGNVIID